jgi:hypothetical protein
MADVVINKFTTQILRDGATPSSPGFVVSEGQDPVNPPGTNNFVPYSGAISNVELGEYGLESGFITLDTTPTGTPVDQGTIYWDDSKSTAALIMNGTTQHIGQDSFFYVKNSTGSSIAKGVAVRFDGTDGASGHLKIAPFLADGTYPSSYFMGVTAEAIGNGEFGQVMHFGELEGIDTRDFDAGDLLYASTTSAGGFQTTAPVAPNNIVLIAAAVNSKNNGAIIVRPTYGSNINDDEGVKIVSPTTGDLLQLQASGLWENKTKAQVLGGTSSQFVKGDGTLDSTSYQPLLTNPVTGTGTTNYLPKFTSASTIGNSQVFDNGTNVGIGTITPPSRLSVQWDKSTAFSGLGIYDSQAFNVSNHGGTVTFGGKFNSAGSYTEWSAIGGMKSNTTDGNISGDINFYTRIDSSAMTERMRIFSDGNVLIQSGGTFTNAGYKLDVNGTGRFSGNTTITGNLTLNGAVTRNINFFNDTSSILNAQIQYDQITSNSGQLFFGTNNAGTFSTKLTITSGGNLGLGVTPSAWSSSYRAFQFGATGVLWANATGTDWYLGNNEIYNSSNQLVYLTNGKASEYFQFDGKHIWNTAPSGTAGNAISFTQAMTLFSTGNLGIGVGGTDSGFKLDVNGTGRFSGNLTVSGNTNNIYSYSNDANGQPGLVVANNSTLGTSNNISYFKTYNYAATTLFGQSVLNYLFVGTEGSSNNGILFGTVNSAPVILGTANTERMRITSGGNVGIGTTSPITRLDVNSGGVNVVAAFRSTDSGAFVGFADPSTTLDAGYPTSSIGVIANDLILSTSNTERMRITSGGSVCINSTTPLDASAKLNVSGNVYLGLQPSGAGTSTLKYNTGTGLVSFDTSARIFKKNITDLEYGLSSVLKMSSKIYKWKSNDKEDLGFIADEMFEIIPEVVYLADNRINQTELKNGEPLGINYDRLIPVLVNAIKELKQEIDTLKN